VDRYHFEADPYPGLDPTFHCRADPDPVPTLRFKMVKNPKFFLTFIHSNASYILVIDIGVIIFNILDNINVADPRWLSRILILSIPDPGPWIPYPGSNYSNKRGGGKHLFSYLFFVATNMTKLKFFLFLNTPKSN
jgi:hypothetical protein